MAKPHLIITCEHGGNKVPAPYRQLFKNEQALLNSHRGYDPGAISLAKLFAKEFEAPLYYSMVTRLLIELNRSDHHKQLFSKVSKHLSPEERQYLIDTLYAPYRQQVVSAIKSVSDHSSVVHLSIHSFTPVINGKTRNTGIGLLFDPSRAGEAQFCQAWKAQLKQVLPDTLVHFNRPYRGTSDGFTTALRKQFSDEQYLGIELEVNQKFLADKSHWRKLQQQVVNSLKQQWN